MREKTMTDIINILSQLSKQQPEAIAVRHTTDEITYKQLDEVSSKLAHQLQDSRQTYDFIWTYVTIMLLGMIWAVKAGLWFVPIDTSVPEERVKMIIDKVQPEYIFNTTDYTLDQQNDQVITVDNVENWQDPVIFDSPSAGAWRWYAILTAVFNGNSSVYNWIGPV